LELGVIYFPTNWGAKEPQNLPNHRVVKERQVIAAGWEDGLVTFTGPAAVNARDDREVHRESRTIWNGWWNGPTTTEI